MLLKRIRYLTCAAVSWFWSESKRVSIRTNNFKGINYEVNRLRLGSKEPWSAYTDKDIRHNTDNDTWTLVMIKMEVSDCNNMCQTVRLVTCMSVRHSDLKCRCYTCEEFYYTTFSSDQYHTKEVSVVVNCNAYSITNIRQTKLRMLNQTRTYIIQQHIVDVRTKVR